MMDMGTIGALADAGAAILIILVCVVLTRRNAG